MVIALEAFYPLYLFPFSIGESMYSFEEPLLPRLGTGMLEFKFIMMPVLMIGVRLWVCSVG
jgi:hypothetical protein